MKSGMEMMLESMGIQTGAIKQLLDPENVKKLLTKIETMCDEVSRTWFKVEELSDAVKRIEIKLGTLPESVAMQLLENGASEAFKDVAEFVKGYNSGNSRDSNNGNGSDSRSINGDANSDGNGRGI